MTMINLVKPRGNETQIDRTTKRMTIDIAPFQRCYLSITGPFPGKAHYYVKKAKYSKHYTEN